uniref:Uncharacterized protein n=1 Tax=Oryza punctata TaxID=4537 RepID=A0A0E0K0Q5_ORYPU
MTTARPQCCKGRPMVAAAATGVVAEQQQLDEARTECAVRGVVGWRGGPHPDVHRPHAGERFDGWWACGICTEAASELRRCDPALAVHEHCVNTTVCVNPALCLTRCMRDIVRISCRNRSGVSAASPSLALSGGAKIGHRHSATLLPPILLKVVEADSSVAEMNGIREDRAIEERRPGLHVQPRGSLRELHQCTPKPP